MIAQFMSRRVLFIAGLIFGSLLTGAGAGWGQEAKGSAKKIVSMTFDFGDGVEKRFTALAWKDEMTILGALTQAAEHPRGIKFKSRGKKETTLILEIDALANGTNDKYWVYSLNGKEGDSSCAIVKLQPGDAILWRFSTYP